MTATVIVEHILRHGYGRVVASLCNRIGPQRVELVEDSVQNTLLKALG